MVALRLDRSAFVALTHSIAHANHEADVLGERDKEILQLVLRTANAQLDRLADRVLALLAQLEDLRFGLPVDQLTHSLQTAARAEAAGADDEWVVASLCHDIGKVIPYSNHQRIVAELLTPFVRSEVVEVVGIHTSLQEGHWELVPRSMGPMARRFVLEWDLPSFDPDYPTPGLDHYEGFLRRVLRPRLEPSSLECADA